MESMESMNGMLELYKYGLGISGCSRGRSRSSGGSRSSGCSSSSGCGCGRTKPFHQ